MQLHYVPILITESCSAGCKHCPFGVSQTRAEPRLDAIISKISVASADQIFLITGGEPLEFRSIRKIVEALERKEVYFRIATGGHIPLIGFNREMSSSFLAGVSVGTDVINPGRNNPEKHAEIWLKNLDFLVKNEISYSLTLSFSGQEDFKAIPFLRFNLKKLNPAFVMVLIRKNIDNTELRNKILESFGFLTPVERFVFELV